MFITRNAFVCVTTVMSLYVSEFVYAWDAPSSERQEDVASSNIVIVEAIGSGTTPEEAEKNAISNAVQQAVGAMIDTETQVKNEEVIKEQILTYSDGFVEKKEVIKQPIINRQSGLIETRIKAWVRRGEVGKKLKAANISLSSFDGESAWAQSLSKRERSENAFKMLANAIKDWPYKLILARMVDYDGHMGDKAVPKIEPVENKPGYTDVSFYIELSFDLDAYRQRFMPQMIKVLKEISEPLPDISIKRKEIDTGRLSEILGINKDYSRLKNYNAAEYKTKSSGYHTAIYGREYARKPVEPGRSPVRRNGQEVFLVSIGLGEHGNSETFAAFNLPEEKKYAAIKWWTRFWSPRSKEYTSWRHFPPLIIKFKSNDGSDIRVEKYELRGTAYCLDISPRFFIDLYGDLTSDVYCEEVKYRFSDEDIRKIQSVDISLVDISLDFENQAAPLPPTP